MRPTSDESKQAAGTFTPARTRPPLGIPTGLPEAPTWLTEMAKKEWDSLVLDLHATGMLTKADASLIGALCELRAELAEAPRKMSAGKLKELRMLSAEFGCSFSSRLKMKQPEGVKPPEPCKPKTDGKVVNISELLSNTRKPLSQEKLRPADTSASPASDS